MQDTEILYKFAPRLIQKWGQHFKICKKRMKPAKSFWYCEIDKTGQRTGNYYQIDIPVCLVVNKGGFNYLGVDMVHETGAVETAGTCFLFTSEVQAQRAALS